MNWCQARDYCRKHLESDLASISNETQYEEVIRKGKNQTFWIGLVHDEWKWEDEGCSTYRDWDANQDWEMENKCIQLLEQKLYTQDCENQGGALCSTGKQEQSNTVLHHFKNCFKATCIETLLYIQYSSVAL